MAAFVALHDHLEAHPPKIWQAVLEQTETAAPRRITANYGPIVFSLQERGSGSWVVVPYVLPTRHFTHEQLANRAALAEAHRQEGNEGEAREWLRRAVSAAPARADTRKAYATFTVSTGDADSSTGSSSRGP